MKRSLEHIERHLMAGGQKSDDGGAWRLPHKGVDLAVIASWGGGWDHVSVSLQNRCPVWDEMNHIKDVFFDEHECVMQLHPPKNEWINNHPNCLHLWRPHGTFIPTPPQDMVGVPA